MRCVLFGTPMIASPMTMPARGWHRQQLSMAYRRRIRRRARRKTKRVRLRMSRLWGVPVQFPLRDI